MAITPIVSNNSTVLSVELCPGLLVLYSAHDTC